MNGVIPSNNTHTLGGGGELNTNIESFKDNFSDVM
jgi:hypothetical protein